MSHPEFWENEPRKRLDFCLILAFQKFGMTHGYLLYSVFFQKRKFGVVILLQKCLDLSSPTHYFYCKIQTEYL